MTDKFEEMLKRQITGDTIVYRAALAEGVKIGERDMRLKLAPIVEELCQAVFSLLQFADTTARKEADM